MDRFSPIAPAQIRVLVLAVGHFERGNFSKFLRRLQNEAAVIGLGDVAQHVENDGFLFSPKAFPAGSLLYNYHSSTPSDQQQLLSPFELFREPLLVLGVVGHAGGQDEEELSTAAEYIRERHHRVVHRHLLILDGLPPGGNKGTGSRTYIARSEEDGDPSLYNAICQMSASFLTELSTYTSAMQASPTIQTPGLVAKKQHTAPSVADSDRRPASSQGIPTSGTAPTSPPSENPPRLHTSNGDTSATNSFEHMRGVGMNAGTLSRSDSQSSTQSRGHGRTGSQDRISLSHDKAKFRGKSRVGIVIGTLYLMAGQWSEALRLLVEHTTKARAFSDDLWHGKGLENILACLLLHVRASLDFQVPTICYQFGDKTSAPQQRFSVNLPSDFRAADFANQKSSTRLSSYIPDLLRHILQLYHSGEGALGLPILNLSEATIRFCKLLTFLHISNGDVESTSFRNSISNSPNIVESTKSSGSFGSKTFIADLLSGVQPVTTDDFPVEDVVGILSGTATIYGLLQMDRKKGNVMRSLINILTEALGQARKRGAAEMGIHPAASFSADPGATATVDVIRESPGIERMVSEVAQLYGIQHQSLASAETRLVNDVYGSEALKMAIARDLIAFCEASPDPQGVVRLAVAMLNSATLNGAADTESGAPTPSISSTEQSRLATAITRAIGMSKYLGLSDAQAVYWDRFLVRGVEFAPSTPGHAMTQRSTLLVGEAQEDSATPANPLLYDRNASRPGTAIEIPVYTLVQNETSFCIVTLQNPCEIPVTIERISLVTDGVEIPTSQSSIVLKPLGLQKVSLCVLPDTIGAFKVTACRVKIAGCAEHDFAIVSRPWTPKQATIFKETGLAAKSTSYDGLPGQQPRAPEGEIVSALVIPAQPVLEIHETSLVDSTSMLLEGEVKTFVVVLHNSSTVPASVFNVTSTDNSVRFVGWSEGVKAEHTQPKGDALELPVVLNSDNYMTFHFEATGTTTLAHVQLMFSYSVDDAQAKFVRQISHVVDFSVKAGIKLQSFDVIPLDKSTENLSGNDLLLSVDVGNTWSQTVSYSLSFGKSQNGKHCAPAKEGALSAGDVKRLQIPFSREVLGVKFGDGAQAIKQAMMECLHLSWLTGSRTGTTDTSSLKLSEEAGELLRGSPVRVNLQVGPTDQSVIRAGSFMTVHVRICPVMENTIGGHVLVQLRPQAAHGMEATLDDRRIVVAGSLQRIIPPMTDSKEAVVDFTVCPLLSGPIELVALVRPAQISAHVPASSWQATDSLVLHVV